MAGGGGGLDVFERLANAHTLASQAKVIQRVTVDKEALLQEVGIKSGQLVPPTMSSGSSSSTFFPTGGAADQ
eukprot:jgi/Hompol1/6399/HPOL_000855-RA